MAVATKSDFLDDRYWFDDCQTVCKKSKHLQSFFYHVCNAFPEELPPEYWNGEKPCPKREEKPDSSSQKN